MLQHLKERLSFKNGLELDHVEALSLLSDIQLDRTQAMPLQDMIWGHHPRYGSCAVVIRIVGRCYFLWSSTSIALAA